MSVVHKLLTVMYVGKGSVGNIITVSATGAMLLLGNWPSCGKSLALSSWRKLLSLSWVLVFCSLCIP